MLYIIALVYLFLLPFLGVSRKAFLIAWSCPCGLAFVALMFAGGHPSGIIFLPIVIIIWGIGLTPLIFVKKNRKEIITDEGEHPR